MGGNTVYTYEPHEYYYYGSKYVGGGIRISKIETSDGINSSNNQIQNFIYEDTENPSFGTSGRLFWKPVFAYPKIQSLKCEWVSDELIDETENFYQAFTYSRNYNHSNLSAILGSPIGYKEVKISTGGNGYTIFKFNCSGTFDDPAYKLQTGLESATTINPLIINSSVTYTDCNYPLSSNNSFPFPANTNYAWDRGELLQKLVYDNGDNIITEEIHDYDYFYLNGSTPDVLYGIKVGEHNFFIDQGNVDDGESQYVFAKYKILTNLKKILSSITQKVYDQSNNQNVITTTKNFTYDGHGQVSVFTTIGSDGKVLKTEYQYPYSFSSDLVNFSMSYPSNNIVAQPIEIINYKNNNVINATITRFGCYDCNMYQPGFLIGGKFLPSKTYQLETNVPLSDYQPVSTDFTIDSRCSQQINIDDYDDYGNLTQYHKINNYNKSYIWGYNGEYLVIEADNIDITTLRTAVNSIQSDLESFLKNTIGDLTSSSQKTAWSTFNTSLRNHTSLNNVFIKTYTYKPLVGVTSETDVNGKTTYYEYDDFNRLKIIKDYDGNILKQYEYHYKNQ